MARKGGGSFASAVKISAILVSVMALVYVAECLFRPVAKLGITPRTGPGLLGILFAPLLHVTWEHLAANAPPLFLLLVLLFWDRRYQAWRALATIWVASGAGTWLIGRGGAMHVGASSVIYGLAAYLIVSGFLMGSWRGFFTGILVFLVYGGIFYGVLPHAGPISWEGHLCGAIAGAWTARETTR
jgi:membrane associated rhomboid family serine protease